MHQHDVGRAHDAGNRNDIGEEVEIEPGVERCVDGVRRPGQKERITVRGRSYDRLGADIGAGSWSVLYDECLAESLGQPLSYRRAMMSVAPLGPAPTTMRTGLVG